MRREQIMDLEKGPRRSLHDPGCGGFLVREEILAEDVFVPLIRCVNCGWYGFREDEACTKSKL